MSDSQLANDRTFLAWLRTGIALFGLGFVVAKVALIVEPGSKGASDQALYAGLGVLLIFSGAALILVGYRQHTSVAASLDHDDPPPLWPRTIAAVAVAASFILSALIIVTT